MRSRNLLGVQAFLACDPHGRAEPVVVTIFDPADTVTNPIGADEIQALEQVIVLTGYEGLVSFLIEAAYLDHMAARAGFVMGEFFQEERAILLVRCDSEVARRAFLEVIKQSFELRPLARRGNHAEARVNAQLTT